VEFATGLPSPGRADAGTVAVDDGPRSFADAVRLAMSESAARRARRVRVTDPDAPAWTVTYRVPHDSTQIASLRRRAQARADSRSADRDTAWRDMAASILAIHCERVECHGALAAGDDGQPLTWRDPGLWAVLGVASSVDAVLAAYGSDAVVDRISAALLAESGMGGTDTLIVEDDRPDPTTR